jgi:REP element-mobilizing transposase RayT
LRGRSSRLLREDRKWKVHELLQRISNKRHIKVYRFANVGNHLHMLVQARTRAEFQAFLREFAGAVAVSVTGAAKGRPEKFWDGIAWSMVVEWGRQFRNAARYIMLNVLESSGLRDRELLARLERDGFVILGEDPP